MSKYATLITQEKKEKDAALAPARAKEMEAKLGLEIAERELQLQSVTNRVEALKGNYPLDTFALIDALDELSLAERQVNQLRAVSKELFA